MKKINMLKLSSIILVAVAMIMTSITVTANTKTLTTMTTNSGEYFGGAQTTSRYVVWDNGGDDLTGNGLSSQNDLIYPFNSQVADDFQLTAAADITGVCWWGVFWNGEGSGYPVTTEFNVIFYADDGTGNMPTGAGSADPTSTALAVYNFPAVTGDLVGTDRYVYEVTLPTAFSAAAGVKYWVCCQWVGSLELHGQWGWVTNGVEGPDQLHVAMQGFPLFGKPYWSYPGTTPDQYGDMAYFLLSGLADTTPPATTCEFEGTMEGGVYITDVTATLSATDAGSGVNYTMYKIDDGAWTPCTQTPEGSLEPFIVSGNGEHTLHFYSVDIAGNIETEKTSVFTIQYPIQIAIKGGLGVSATITNNGESAVTNITWSINLNGGRILLGKTKTGTVDIPAGESVTVKDFVFGFGKTTITVAVGSTEATESGTVILFFVIGVA